MKLHITKVQEFRNSPADPPVYEITGDVPSGFGVPQISGEYELVSERVPAASASPSVAPTGSQDRDRSGVGTRSTASPEAKGANPNPSTTILGKSSDLIVPCHPTKVYKSQKRLVVCYQEARQEAQHLKAYDRYLACWDEALFEAIKATEGQDAEFCCVEVAKGGTKFVNIVGVKVRTEAARA